MNDVAQGEFEQRSPICECRECKNSDEAGCAVVTSTMAGRRQVQCGMEGGHDGDCCEWQPVHGADQFGRSGGPDE